MEELTTDMHEEFIGGEINGLDIKVMGVYGAVARGVDFQEALKQYDISEAIYNRNIDRVLS
ncbi:hypothetical protein [Niabella drilacis]|uniref:Uncharacterized protein n=1 Tax=Niabella drilacis (strain DSM 25811 / CCM 8410 / CCUG 62505 / LMG 26954 / E90) TaxID=1285928 RepID=A0A1G6J2Q3_NIADE|nr:hypothetical protein [Niabella drilacis]SDC12927.1 hypothetical protein SAMN04487894_101400 [Niabella drilacis]